MYIPISLFDYWRYDANDSSMSISLTYAIPSDVWIVEPHQLSQLDLWIERAHGVEDRQSRWIYSWILKALWFHSILTKHHYQQ